MAPSIERSGEPSTLPFRYGVYGISVRSEIPLALPDFAGCGLTEIVVRTATAGTLAAAITGADLQGRSKWCRYAHVADGSSYVRWNDLGEFWVSATGDQILCLSTPGASMESFQVYLLGQALSVAMVKRGFEPLHGTAIVADAEAILLLGHSGYGKSTLAAGFLDAGYSLLTDDLLLLSPSGTGYCAHPGPPRIKLFPKEARRFLGLAAEAVPMNSATQKHIIPVSSAQRCSDAAGVRAIYVLAPPHEMRHQRRVVIEPMSSREAFVALVSNTFNTISADSKRLQRQVSATARLLQFVPLKKLSYPRSLDRLPDVRDAILSDSRAVRKLA